MPTLVIDGHPNPDSLSAAIAAGYARAHGDATLLAIRDLDFDPVLRLGYRGEQALEPDLAAAQRAIERADHVVVVVPVWWGSIPALAKGFFDRAFLPRWAFRYRANGLVEGLLAGRSGRVIVTTDSPLWYLRAVGDTTVRAVRDRTMRFSGIRPVRALRLGPVRGSSDERRRRWLARVERVAAIDRARADRRRADSRRAGGGGDGSADRRAELVEAAGA